MKVLRVLVISVTTAILLCAIAVLGVAICLHCACGGEV